jgi:hypothetical protein
MTSTSIDSAALRKQKKSETSNTTTFSHFWPKNNPRFLKLKESSFLHGLVKKTILALVLAACPILTTSHAVTLSFQTIDMLAIGKGNASITDTGTIPQSYPYGSPATLGEVPFLLTNQANQVWAASNATGGTGQGLVSETFTMNVPNIYGFYTLANTYWGDNNVTHVTYRFSFSDNSVYDKTLTNGVDIRDFAALAPDWAATINNTTTQNVFASNNPNAPYYLDRQWIDLHAAGHGGKNLTSFTIFDNGGSFDSSVTPYTGSRIFLTAATAQVGIAGQQGVTTAVPEPGQALSSLLLLTGIGAYMCRRHRPKKSATCEKRDRSPQFSMSAE